MLTREELLLCKLLRCALLDEKFTDEDKYTYEEMDKAVLMAGRHSVLSLLYDIIQETKMKGNDIVEKAALQTVQQSYHLLLLSKYIVNTLKKNGIVSVILKGSSTAALYPVPELRKSGDIDLLLSGMEDVKKACDILKEAGFCIKEEQHAHHHVVCQSPDGIDLELHGMLVEPFDNNKVNNYIRSRQKNFLDSTVWKEIMGVRLPVLSDPYHAFYLLLHMLQHFLRSGFGIKLLADWSVFWNRDISEESKDIFVKIAKESGTYGFIRMITAVCIQYLGLKADNVSFIISYNDIISSNNIKQEEINKEDIGEFMKEVLEAEEFGKSSAERMVVLRNTGIISYIREFHHQMRLTYPKASHIIVIWPVLWIMTLAGFIYRNKSVRNVSGAAVLKKAAQRSRVVKKMNLFE